MISLVRVDDRLIHGQVTVGWVPHLGATRIIVVNDRLAGEPILAAIVKSGGTARTAVDVFSIEAAISLFRHGKFKEDRVILLFESLRDAHRAFEKGLGFNSLNLGGLRGSGEGIRIADAVFLSKADQEIIRKLRLGGVAVEVRLMPGDRSRSLTEGEEGP